MTLLGVSAAVGFSDEPAKAELSVSTDFPGGSGEVVSIDAAANEIHLRPSVTEGRGWPCWWYVRVANAKAGEKFTLRVTPAEKPFRGDATLAGDWTLPDRVAIRFDAEGESWTRMQGERVGRNEAKYEFFSPGTPFFVAWGVPFLSEDAERALADAAEKLPSAERFTLATTREGRPVPAIRVGGGTAEEPARFGIWVQARQHAWESGSSWVGKGFLRWIVSDDLAAVELRKKATIWFVPIMDVDSVAQGFGGKEAVPRDHNRDWTDASRYPEVTAAQERLRELNAAGKLDLFVDLHNPGASSKRPFFFGPHDLDDRSDIERRNYADWIAMAAGAIAGPLPLEERYQVASYIKTDEERARMGANWVRDHSAPHVVSVTLETAWNTPRSSTGGYQAVGRQLGEATAKYIARDPRREVARP